MCINLYILLLADLLLTNTLQLTPQIQQAVQTQALVVLQPLQQQTQVPGLLLLHSQQSIYPKKHSMYTENITKIPAATVSLGDTVCEPWPR